MIDHFNFILPFIDFNFSDNNNNTDEKDDNSE